MAKERLKIQQIDDVAMVRFLDKRILDESVIQTIGEQLQILVDEGSRFVLLNFTGVDYMSSAALGKFINLHKKLSGNDGTLAICQLIPHIFEVFTITKLDKMFKIYPDEASALTALKSFVAD